MQTALHRVALEVGGRDEVRTVLIRGANGRLSVGADIHEMERMSREETERLSWRLQETFTAVAKIPQPVIAVIERYALGGGCELALAADIRFAAADAGIALPEVHLGLMPGAGGTQRLTRLVGPGWAKELILTGRRVSGEEAQRIGLVNRVMGANVVLEEARAFAAILARGPAGAMRAAKRAIDACGECGLTAGLEIERGLFAGLFGMSEGETGMRSFVENGPGKARFTVVQDPE